MTSPSDPQATGEKAGLSILVGVPDAGERARVSAMLRAEGHAVIEAADARAMRARLDELDRAGGPDAIVCAGLLAEHDDSALAARLSSVSSTLILLPAGGLLSTASRAQRLGASAVLPDVPALRRLRELLSSPVAP
jgi:DNA-binding NtrC family response regulator